MRMKKLVCNRVAVNFSVFFFFLVPKKGMLPYFDICYKWKCLYSIFKYHVSELEL